MSRGAGRVLKQLREAQRTAARKIDETARRPKRELDEALGRGSSGRVEDGTTSGRLESRTDEADPPPGREDGPSRVDNIVRARKAFARDFYRRQGYSERRLSQHVKGIDFGKPVQTKTIPKGTRVVQYQVPGGRRGHYYAPPGSQPTELGINPRGQNTAGETVPKQMNVYETTEDVEVLQSTASDALDDWSTNEPYQTDGGGTQFFTTSNNSFTSTTP